ncbi:unnamed protein product [Spodoptera littoralis]|uniref:Uncharacterized protein n=1 Tax=Spodoptera littoralis TaxID=7109 RepID=A0A9P0NAW9_SPOLI|nr:unnamed protein product [Spodoptera littoralis]CAH1647862.1 unnamed protein product [Spodoptera littoralis]
MEENCLTEQTFMVWSVMLEDICEAKGFDLEEVQLELTSCGLPGSIHVTVPQYRTFFDTYRSKNAMINEKGHK